MRLRRKNESDDRALARRLDQIFGGELYNPDEMEPIPDDEEGAPLDIGLDIAPDNYRNWYSVIPRLNTEVKMSDLLKVTGDSFTLLYIRTGDGHRGGISCFINSSASKQSLARYFDVRYAVPKPLPYAAVARARRFRRDPYYTDFYVADLPGIASRLPERSGLAYGISSDMWLYKVLHNRKSRMEKKAYKIKFGRSGGNIPAELDPLTERLRKGVYLPSLIILAENKDLLKEAVELVRHSLSMPIAFTTKKIKKGKEFYKLLEPPKMTVADRLSVNMGISGFLAVTREKIEDLLALPDPRMHDVPFVRTAAVPVTSMGTNTGEGRSMDSDFITDLAAPDLGPATPTTRYVNLTDVEEIKQLQRQDKSETAGLSRMEKKREKKEILIGRLDDGKPFTLTPSDFFRHAYLIGQTGTGKTNLLKLLARYLHAAGYPVFVIDPHGELGEELAETTPDAVYLHPIRSPFGVNPLELPPFEERDQAITISLDTLMNLFTNVFRLPETAVNVRYILQTVARQIYNVGGTPTLAGIYKIVMGVYNGADVGISDENFREHEKLLRNMPDQSFISTLGRLQSFAEDPLLRKLTSSTTIDLDSMIDEDRMVIFSVPQPDVGLVASTLVCSTLLLKLYYTVLARVRGKDREKKKDVFVIVDEFQTLQSLPILSNILSEARKFGLHLIIAHQYAEQLSDEVFQAAMNNTGVKFVFQVSGNDVYRFKSLDPAFGREIESIAPSLPTGECLVKLTTRPEDAQTPPLIVRVNPDTAPKVRLVEEAATDAYTPEDVELDLSLVNPVLKYIDLPFPPKQKIIKILHESGGKVTATELKGHLAYMRQDAFEKILNSMAAQGYVLIKRTSRGRAVSMTDKFFEEFYKVAPSEEGKKLTKLAVLYYLSQGYYVAPTKNIPLPRPDLVVIPYKEFYLDYRGSIEVEIEATTFDKKEEHLKDTVGKGTPFREKHIWCFEKNLKSLAEYLKFASPDKDITIFKVGKDRVVPVKLEDILNEIIDESEIVIEGSPENADEHAQDQKTTASANTATTTTTPTHATALKINEMLDEGVKHSLEEIGLLEFFIEDVENCMMSRSTDNNETGYMDDVQEVVNELAMEVVEDPSRIADVCIALQDKLKKKIEVKKMDEEAMAAVAEAIRINKNLEGREDVVDEMLRLTSNDEGIKIVKELASMNLNADMTFRILRILNKNTVFFKAIKGARDIEKLVSSLESKLNIDKADYPPSPKVKVKAKKKHEEVERLNQKTEQEQKTESESAAKSTENKPTEKVEQEVASKLGKPSSQKQMKIEIEPEDKPKSAQKPRSRKKKLSKVVIGALGGETKDIETKNVIKIKGKKIAILKGDVQSLRLDASLYDMYLIDERKTPVSDKLPDKGLISIEQAHPGSYTLLIISGEKIISKYIVEVLN